MAKTPFTEVVRDLVSQGIISSDVFDKLEQARRVWGGWLLSSPEKMPPPTVADVEDLLALLRRLRGEMAATAAG